MAPGTWRLALFRPTADRPVWNCTMTQMAKNSGSRLRCWTLDLIGSLNSGERSAGTSEQLDKFQANFQRNSNRSIAVRLLGAGRSVGPQNKLTKRPGQWNGLVSGSVTGTSNAPSDRQPWTGMKCYRTNKLRTWQRRKEAQRVGQMNKMDILVIFYLLFLNAKYKARKPTQVFARPRVNQLRINTRTVHNIKKKKVKGDSIWRSTDSWGPN